MNCVRSSAGQGQHATPLKHSFRFAEPGALFVRQNDKFVHERVCRNVVPAEDLGIICEGQRQHQSGSLADLARFFDRVVNIRLRRLRVARRAARPTASAARPWITAGCATAQWKARFARRYPPKSDPFLISVGSIR